MVNVPGVNPITPYREKKSHDRLICPEYQIKKKLREGPVYI